MSTGPNPGPATTTPPRPTIHEAELASGATGAVEWAAEIDFATAVARRRAEENVVIRGPDLDANRALAEQIEAAVGPSKRGVPHLRWAGNRALPHFQQVDSRHDGHTFYETPRRRALRKRP